MNIFPIFLGSNRLKKVRNVVHRLVCKEFYINTPDTVQPKDTNRIFYLLYVLFTNQKEKIKQLIKEVETLRTLVTTLNKDLKSTKDELKYYEQKVRFEGFSATIYYYCWTCGDGCCSEGYYWYCIKNKEGITMVNPSGDGVSCRSYLEEKIREDYGNIPIHEEYVEDKWDIPNLR